MVVTGYSGHLLIVINFKSPEFFMHFIVKFVAYSGQKSAYSVVNLKNFASKKALLGLK